MQTCSCVSARKKPPWVKGSLRTPTLENVQNWYEVCGQVPPPQKKRVVWPRGLEALSPTHLQFCCLNVQWFFVNRVKIYFSSEMKWFSDPKSKKVQYLFVVVFCNEMIVMRKKEQLSCTLWKENAHIFRLNSCKLWSEIKFQMELSCTKCKIALTTWQLPGVKCLVYHANGKTHISPANSSLVLRHPTELVLRTLFSVSFYHCWRHTCLFCKLFSKFTTSENMTVVSFNFWRKKKTHDKMSKEKRKK